MTEEKSKIGLLKYFHNDFIPNWKIKRPVPNDLLGLMAIFSDWLLEQEQRLEAERAEAIRQAYIDGEVEGRMNEIAQSQKAINDAVRSEVVKVVERILTGTWTAPASARAREILDEYEKKEDKT